MINNAIKTLTKESFNDKVLGSDISKKFMLIKFWATWCGPCELLNPIIDDLFKKYSNAIDFFSFQVLDSDSLPDSVEIKGLPTVLMFKDGKEIDRKVGVNSDTPSTYDHSFDSWIQGIINSNK